MAVPKTLVWPLEPHTAAKHGILRGYLDAYWPILLQSRRPSQHLTYAEGFAGPNEYSNGEDGSPNHALAALLRHRRLLQPGTIVNIVLVEEHAGRLDNCLRRIDQRFGQLPRQIRVHARQGSCADTLPPLLDEVQAWDGSVFANLDPFGVDVPYTLVQQIGAHGRASEAFITFNADFFTRWANHEHVEAADRQFGTTAWRTVDQQPPREKKRWLIDAYRRRLFLARFKHTLAFELLDQQGHQLALVHATSGLRGVERMKDAMWKVDPVRGVRFRDPRDTRQLAIDIQHEPDLTPLDQLLDEHLTTQPRHDITALREWATTETAYRAQHLDLLLRKRKAEQRITVGPTQHLRAGNWIEPAPSTALGTSGPAQDALF
jgi:three-Cys-motif partner protein